MTARKRDQNQMTFDFIAEPAAAYEAKKKKSAKEQKKPEKPLSKQEEKDLTDHFQNLNLRRAVIGWLFGQDPNGIGVQVPTRFSKFQADIAAFWSAPVKGRYLMPSKTMIVEIRHNREVCWPECSRSEKILPLLKEQKEIKRQIEEKIREEEPELKDTDNLFGEYETWNYPKSKNRSYHLCLKKIEQLEHSLYKGSRFEQMRRAHVANNLYLAVPAGTVHADELVDGWGLIYVDLKDFSAKIEKPSSHWDCPMENKFHLVQNIASSCVRSLAFSYGIRKDAGDEIIFTRRIPKRRRK